MRGLIVLGTVLTAGAPAAAADKPNVLFIAIDDLRDWVGFLGDKQAKTPNLDKLAAHGLVFTRSYCAAPVCNPSRTALLTGLRPGVAGVAGWRGGGVLVLSFSGLATGEPGGCRCDVAFS